MLLITLSFPLIALFLNLLTSKNVFIEIISHDEIYSWMTFYFNLGPIRYDLLFKPMKWMMLLLHGGIVA